MQENNFDIWTGANKVTPEVIAYYREHPDQLDLIVDKEHFHKKFLYFFFVLGLILTIGSRILGVVFKDEYLHSLLFDVMSELGIAIFGGAVTAYFIEFLKNKQFQQNIEYREKIRQAIEELEAKDQ